MSNPEPPERVEGEVWTITKEYVQYPQRGDGAMNLKIIGPTTKKTEVISRVRAKETFDQAQATLREAHKAESQAREALATALHQLEEAEASIRRERGARAGSDAKAGRALNQAEAAEARCSSLEAAIREHRDDPDWAGRAMEKYERDERLYAALTESEGPD